MQSSSPLVTTIVEAGAGTGKTESLARRILLVAESLYEAQEGDRKVLPKLVATTFTERATAELRERVSLLLAGRESAPLWLNDFVQDPERLQISTIHGTLSSILHRFGTLIGLDPDFNIIDEIDDRKILGEVLRTIISTEPELGILFEQFTFGELLNLCKDLMSHYRLHRKNFSPLEGWQQILNETSHKLSNAIGELSRIDLGGVPEKTALSLKSLQELAQPLSQKHLSFAAKRQIFLEATSVMRKPTVRLNWPQAEELKKIIGEIFELRDVLKSESYDVSVNERHDEVSRLLQKLTLALESDYALKKKELGSLTFDDLEFLTLELLEIHPEILAIVKQDYDFWFVDEYQDTSPLQKKILFKFFRDQTNSYFVGDPQQSIYLFRGADESVFQETKKLVESLGGVASRLEVNYRSHPDLLVFLNKIFLSLKKPLIPLKAKGALEGSCRANVILISENTDVNATPSEEEMAAYQCHQWRSQGHEFHEMAILVRTNEKAKEMARVLNKSQIPVYVHASGGFYDRREILDALGFLSFLENPSNDQLFILITRSPWMSIEDPILSHWAKLKGRDTFWEWCLKNQDVFANSPPLSHLKKAIEMTASWPLSMVFETLLDNLGLFELSLVGDASGRNEANLRKFLWKIREEEKLPGFSACRFLERAWQEIEDTPSESEAASFVEPERVNILTIHKSKGLKFDCVIVPFCGDASKSKSSSLELAPDGTWATKILSSESEEKIAPLVLEVLKEKRWEREFSEEARVFYVAITRAAEKLALISQSKIAEKSWFGQTSLVLDPSASDSCHLISVWSEKPTIPLSDEVSGEKGLEHFSLPKVKNKRPLRYSVTEAVRELSLIQESKPQSSLKDSVQLLCQQLESQQRGQAVHFILEELKNNMNQDISLLCDVAKKRFSAEWAIDQKAIENTLKIENPPLALLFRSGFAEWPFEFHYGGHHFEGQIDLWGDDESTGDSWVIDYKSSKNITEEALGKARKQLEIYALAIHKSGRPWDRIRLAVVTPLEGRSYELKLRSLDEISKELALLGQNHRRI